MNCKITLVLIALILVSFNTAIAQENIWTSTRPDGHAPISIMGDHYHKKGEIMISYRYMPMCMDGNLKSKDEISNKEIYSDFMISPKAMQMNMHMIGLMYAPIDRITLMIMGSYISNYMDLRTKKGMNFSTQSGGFGDISVSALIKIKNSNNQSLHANIGVNIPTGNINNKDNTPMMNNVQLANTMQLGSGTWDPSLGLTYLGQTKMLSWGSQLTNKFRLGENSNNYTLGNRFDLTAWGAIKASDYFSFSASMSYFNIKKTKTVNSTITSKMMPLFNTANSGRNQLDLGIGINFYVPKGDFKNIRLSTEIKIPVKQKVNGIQMKNITTATFGIQYTLGHK